MDRRTFLTIALAAPALGTAARELTQAKKPPAAVPQPQPAAGVPWRQWGGPHRNFQTDAST
jgi:hypothetical protein